jgi:hypothetical protein
LLYKLRVELEPVARAAMVVLHAATPPRAP